MPSDLAIAHLNHFSNLKKVTVKHIYYSDQAVDTMEKIHYPNDNIAAKQWSSKWNDFNKCESILMIYVQEKIKKSYVFIKFIIGGYGDEPCSLDSKHYEYDEGVKILDSIGIQI